MIKEIVFGLLIIFAVVFLAVNVEAYICKIGADAWRGLGFRPLLDGSGKCDGILTDPDSGIPTESENCVDCHYFSNYKSKDNIKTSSDQSIGFKSPIGTLKMPKIELEEVVNSANFYIPIMPTPKGKKVINN